MVHKCNPKPLEVKAQDWDYKASQQAQGQLGLCKTLSQRAPK